ncbi:MAG: heavy-metal-associated domain-containing protein [Mycobacteriaceae bacterium]|nr:heavy-metal-associated domain-containing protein [Mycobacteriaceae bacterium]
MGRPPISTRRTRELSRYDGHYDRAAASGVLARLAAPGLFASGAAPADDVLGPPRLIRYVAHPLSPEPGSALTLSQRLYLERFMRPCRPDQITSATHRITWTDSDGVPCTGHYGPSSLGPVVPIAAREALLALWRGLAANTRLGEAALDLSDDDMDVLAATTTDTEPVEIFRIGFEAAARALAQHALLAHRVGHDDPAAFAEALHRSGVFATVAATWYWELQASTFRRGMVPVTLERNGSGVLRYSADTAALLAAMKRTTIAEAQETMRRAVDEEGLSPDRAVRKYHTELDLVAKQYALLDPGTAPRCLALMSHTVDGRLVTVLPTAVEALVSTFTRMLGLVNVEEVASAAAPAAAESVGAQTFHVPDMNCKHCRVTITAVLEAEGAEVGDISLVTKQVVARFDTPAQRDAAFAAIRDSGYTVVTERQ